MAQENLKKAISAIDNLVEQGEKSLADGFQPKDLVDFLAPGLAAGGVDWKAAIQEAKERTDEGNKELIEFFKSDFDIENDEAENRIEKSVAALLAVDDAIRAFKKAA